MKAVKSIGYTVTGFNRGEDSLNMSNGPGKCASVSQNPIMRCLIRLLNRLKFTHTITQQYSQTLLWVFQWY